MNLFTLKRFFREKGTRRHPLEALRNDRADICEVVRDELFASGADIGYRKIDKQFVKHSDQKGTFVEGKLSGRLLSN